MEIYNAIKTDLLWIFTEYILPIEIFFGIVLLILSGFVIHSRVKYVKMQKKFTKKRADMRNKRT